MHGRVIEDNTYTRHDEWCDQILWDHHGEARNEEKVVIFVKEMFGYLKAFCDENYKHVAVEE